jgi:hypothetical protein
MSEGERRRVVVLSRTASTLEGLRHYLGERGIVADTRSRLSVGLLPAQTSAVVLFPDDFAEAGVVRFVRRLRAGRPALLLVVVTREAEPYLALRARDGGTAPVVLSRPPFGWMIVDALRESGSTRGDA